MILRCSRFELDRYYLYYRRLGVLTASKCLRLASKSLYSGLKYFDTLEYIINNSGTSIVCSMHVLSFSVIVASFDQVTCLQHVTAVCSRKRKVIQFPTRNGSSYYRSDQICSQHTKKIIYHLTSAFDVTGPCCIRASHTPPVRRSTSII